MPRARVQAVVDADVTPLQRAFGKAKNQGTALAGALKTQLAAAFSVAAVTRYVHHLRDLASTIRDMSAQMEISTDDAQELRFQFGLTGLTVNDARASFARFNDTRQKATEGNESMIAAFENLGISLATLKDPLVTDIELFRMFGRAGRDASKIASVRTILGPEQLRSLKAISEFADSSNRAPLISPEELRLIDEATKRWEKFGMSLEVVSARSLAQLDSAFDSLLHGRFMEFQKAVSKGIAELTLYPTILRKLGLAPTSRAADAGGRASIGDDAEALAKADTGRLLGVFGDEKLFKLIMDLSKETERTEMAKLDIAERRARIEQQIADLTSQAFLTANEVDRKEIELQAQKLRTQLEGLKITAETPALFRPGTDALSRIGGIVNQGQSQRDRNGQLILQSLRAVERQITERGIRIDE